MNRKSPLCVPSSHTRSFRDQVARGDIPEWLFKKWTDQGNQDPRRFGQDRFLTVSIIVSMCLIELALVGIALYSWGPETSSLASTAMAIVSVTILFYGLELVDRIDQKSLARMVPFMQLSDPLLALQGASSEDTSEEVIENALVEWAAHITVLREARNLRKELPADWEHHRELLEQSFAALLRSMKAFGIGRSRGDFQFYADLACAGSMLKQAQDDLAKKLGK